MVAPIVVSVLLVLYYIGIGSVILASPEVPGLVKFLATVIPLALAGVVIAVLISRINEIRSGEEDDLSKY